MSSARPSVLCLSHLRWNDAEVRPRQLLTRCARERPVAFFEAPVFDAPVPFLDLSHTPEQVVLAVPHLPPRMHAEQAERAQRDMVDELLRSLGDHEPVLWYYSPRALGFTEHLDASAIVYDCLEQLSLRGDAGLLGRERALFERADVVFTCGYGLFRHLRHSVGHLNIHPFVSGIDLEQFQRAREPLLEPPDQQDIAHPRIGFFGSIDESVDLQLLGKLARARPDLQQVLIGPLVGLGVEALPHARNLHWLGAQPLERVPAYVAGWDVAMLPLAHTDATRFGSATRAAECIAAGKPVVATPVVDIVEPWAREGLVWLGEDADEFAMAIDDAMASDRLARVEHGDGYLAEHSWRAIWSSMWAHVEQVMATRTRSPKWLPRPPPRAADGIARWTA